MPDMLRFVSVNPGEPDVDEATSQKAVRSHVMKVYRRRQRQEKRGHQHSGATVLQGDLPRFDAIDTVNDAHAHAHDTVQEGRPPPSGSDRSAFSLCLTGDLRDRTPLSSNQIYKDPRHKYAAVSPHILQSPAAFRNLLLQAFVEGFFPSRDWTCSVMTATIHQWAGSTCSHIMLINEAVGLMHLGGVVQDQQLVREGQKRQIVAVRRFRAALRKPDICFQDALMMVINTMICALFSAPSHGITECASHMTGLMAILQAYGRNPNADPLTPLTKKNCQRLLMMHALMNRRAIAVSNGLVNTDDRDTPGSVGDLLRISWSLTGLLEAASILQDNGQKDFDKADLCSLRACAQDLGEKFDSWLQSRERTGFRYRRSPLEFHSFLDANALGLYWSLRLLLAESLYQVETLHSRGPALTPDPTTCYKHEADMYADYLLETAFAVQAYDGSDLSRAFAVRAPLHFAITWWTRTGNGPRAQKARALESKLRTDLAGIDWETVLYWSFFGILWLE